MSWEAFDMVLQPRSPLENEVEGIYARLLEVETECISVRAACAADPELSIDAKGWQSLIELHRTLLNEHYNFLVVATQAPSATNAMRGVVENLTMPARMWKYGVHALLETLSSRLPESRDFLLVFIWLAYRVLVVLLESVPSFADVWTECLGDLARYGIAVEDEIEARSKWASVATRWYTTVSDRVPTIGRFYHHLGILERVGIRKFCYYFKSLTCVVAFSNARDTLSALCARILQDEETIERGREEVEARIVTYHAMILNRYDIASTTAIGQDSLRLLSQQLAKLRSIGPFLAATNMAALLQLGAPTNVLWQAYTAAVNQTLQNASLTEAANVHTSAGPPANILPDPSVDPFLCSANKYFSDSVNIVASHCNTSGSLEDCLSFMHVSLVCLHSFHALRTRLDQRGRHNSVLFHYGGLDFSALASFFNLLAQQNSESARLLDLARHGIFPSAERKEDARPLSEDYIIRGHVWGQFYFPPGWFECQDDARAMETSSTMKARVSRVLWLGLFLAFHTEHLSFDVQTHVFSATTQRSISLSATTTDSTRLAVTEIPSST